MKFLKQPPEVLYEKSVLKKFTIFTGKLHDCNFIKKRLQYRCFPPNIAKFLRTSSLKNIYQRLLLIFQNSHRTSVMKFTNRLWTIKLYNRDLNRGCLAYMFSLCLSGSKLLTNLRRQFRARKIFSCT